MLANDINFGVRVRVVVRARNRVSNFALKWAGIASWYSCLMSKQNVQEK